MPTAIAASADTRLTPDDQEFLRATCLSLRSLADFVWARRFDRERLEEIAGDVLFYYCSSGFPEVPPQFVTVRELFKCCADEAVDSPFVYPAWAWATGEAVRRMLSSLDGLPRQALRLYADAQDDVMQVTAQEAREALIAWDRHYSC